MLRKLTHRLSRRTPFFKHTSSPLHHLFTTTTPSFDNEVKDPNKGYNTITLKEVHTMPAHVSEYSADLLVNIALKGNAGAIRERVVREVMAVDGVTYAAANKVADDIADANQTDLGKLSLPYYSGMGIGFVMAWACLPLVFDWSTAEWFNARYVTMEIPEPADRETFLEVGSWAWSWAEPVQGTLMFQLLALEFGRNQMLNVGLKPYTAWIVSSRANRLADMFPGYSREIIRRFSKQDTGFIE